jgi:hypothetical protein
VRAHARRLCEFKNLPQLLDAASPRLVRADELQQATERGLVVGGLRRLRALARDDLGRLVERREPVEEAQQREPRLFGDAARRQLLRHTLRADLVQLVERDERVRVPVLRDARRAQDARERLPVVEPEGEVREAQSRERVRGGG